ncbi:RAN protein kinase [Cryptococcus bacillisporus CA1873]|uniref:RAN protein kinase n=1 Tax=Cryptococcus bacillisporus CA1873 TaxID=1296111 RepID=A0ABR5B3Z8_CRYGA|nr:RAN protein kinase [Cryptococcus bacillisporus CA1873]|eukprot:KIR58322.1 RAN protein kinase [Cryptococcus gattii CA1873]
MSTSSNSLHVAGGSPQFIDGGFIELVAVIGTGAYGVVYLAVDSRYPQPVYRAIKCMRRSGLDERQKHFQRREMGLHRLASGHPSIITMDRIFEEGDYIYVVMDYGDEGDLFSMITDKKRYVGDNELIRNVFLQLLDGVSWMHSLGISHRDIKPENIVCSQDGTRVRICDFGLATSEERSSEFGCGSTFYIAPECLGDWFPENKTYPTRSGDIWSLGVILVNLVCGRNPWRIASPSDESFNSYLADPHFLRKILPVSDECLYILTQIFTVHPEERITLPALRQLISEVESFSMTVDELRHAHISAQQKIAAAQPPVLLSLPREDDGWSEQEELFAYDDDLETPSLRSDSDSPRYPLCLSPTTSSNGESLPPTPNLIPDECITFAHQPHSPQFWEYVPKVTFEYDQNQRSTDVHIKVSSPFTYNSAPTTCAQ